MKALTTYLRSALAYVRTWEPVRWHAAVTALAGLLASVGLVLTGAQITAIATLLAVLVGSSAVAATSLRAKVWPDAAAQAELDYTAKVAFQSGKAVQAAAVPVVQTAANTTPVETASTDTPAA